MEEHRVGLGRGSRIETLFRVCGLYGRYGMLRLRGIVLRTIRTPLSMTGSYA
jgi:hypothetical protein